MAQVFSFLVDGNSVEPRVSLGAETLSVQNPAPATPFTPNMITRPVVKDGPADEDDLVEVPLIEVAWARSGDKGDAFNVGVIARRPELLPWIRAALTEDAVKAFFAHEFEGATHPEVRRYELPGMNAVNLHCIQSLGGGQFASLRLDPLAKGKGQQLLDMKVKVPRRLLD